jgi:proline iminopeptidase
MSAMQRRETRVEVPRESVWVREAKGGPGIPLLLLHGGPGFPSRHPEGLEELADERTVVRYDQLAGPSTPGAGRAPLRP